MIDLHSHILPGIDDGSPDFETSVKLVSELARAGVTDVVATPHYIEETIYTSPKVKNSKLLKELQKRLKTEGVDVKIHLGNEIYISKNIKNLVDDGLISGLFESKYLLVELPMSGDFPNSRDIFLELLRLGYKVVLAHPERYVAFQKDFDLVSDLYEMGILLQCNFGSFAGQYGKSVFKLVKRLAKEKMIFAMGSDIHHLHGDKWMEEALKKMKKFYTDSEMEELLVENPKKIML